MNQRGGDEGDGLESQEASNGARHGPPRVAWLRFLG
jgi:hypothetical protein